MGTTLVSTNVSEDVSGGYYPVTPETSNKIDAQAVEVTNMWVEFNKALDENKKFQ